MQSLTYEHHRRPMGQQMKLKNQFTLRRRDYSRHKTLLQAVREWESSLPGQAQKKISQLVAAQWTREGGRGIAVNKQNLFRYLKNEGGSEKYTAYVMQLSGAIVAAMPVEIARKHGLSNARTEAELVACAIKECTEAHQAKLLGAPLQKLEKEICEAAIALFNMLPADAAGPLLASISAVAPQFF